MMNQTLLIETLPVIERLTRTTPLGLRFWDDVTGKVIGDGLVVTAYPPASPLRRIEARVNRSGVYVLSDLPGLREVEFGTGDDEFWSAFEQNSPPPATARFKIEVVDSWRRFMPFLLTIDAPVKNIIASIPDSPASSPPESAQGIPLYSAASRATPAAMAVLRAELREWKTDGNHQGEPARWAVVEARMAGRLLSRGVADENGLVALIFPYPAPVTHPLGSPPAISPPGAEGPALRDQQWTIELSASFDRIRPQAPFPGAPALPDIADVLTQSPATLWVDSERQEALTETTLSFGRELVLRSTTGINATGSVVFISAAGSPP